MGEYKSKGEDIRIFHSFMYKAESLKHQQRVVVKIEVSAKGTNIRYVVTSFKGQRSSFIYSGMLAGTELENCTISTFREKFLLNAVSVDEKKTCIKLRFSQEHPMMAEMYTVLHRLRHIPAA